MLTIYNFLDTLLVEHFNKKTPCKGFIQYYLNMFNWRKINSICGLGRSGKLPEEAGRMMERDWFGKRHASLSNEGGKKLVYMHLPQFQQFYLRNGDTPSKCTFSRSSTGMSYKPQILKGRYLNMQWIEKRMRPSPTCCFLATSFDT